MNFYGPVTINYGAEKVQTDPVAKKTVKQAVKVDKKHSKRYQRRGDYLDKRRKEFEAAIAAEKARKEKIDRCRLDAQRLTESQRREELSRSSKHLDESQKEETRGRRPHREVVTGPAARKMTEMRRNRSRSLARK